MDTVRVLICSAIMTYVMSSDFDESPYSKMGIAIAMENLKSTRSSYWNGLFVEDVSQS